MSERPYVHFLSPAAGFVTSTRTPERMPVSMVEVVVVQKAVMESREALGRAAYLAYRPGGEQVWELLTPFAREPWYAIADGIVAHLVEKGATR